MKTVQLLLFCLLVCQTTESLTDKLVNLGANVTLDCQIYVTDIFWVFQKLTDSPRLILRTFSSESASSHVQDPRLKDKYSSLNLSRLFIINITIHELGIYYCAKAATTTLQFSDGTRLYINEEAARNQTKLKNNSENQNTQKSFIVLCFIPIIVMFLAIIGLFQIKLQACKKRHQQYQDEELEQLYSTNDEEFSEVEFHLFHPNNNTFVPFQKTKTKSRQI
ncbi:uncharacterized protein LOC127988041 isoform X13 [Carassius gibelio]|uniref:uncharacterized protein LOC127988041 isoform X13 n=1 Tax=Carassius gibelio TaxID=101364 RepID=UPI002279DF6F|nr:uncharacterized protein LOC127988041 isoform X13 [Carassius gibelio]